MIVFSEWTGTVGSGAVVRFDDGHTDVPFPTRNDVVRAAVGTLAAYFCCPAQIVVDEFGAGAPDAVYALATAR